MTVLDSLKPLVALCKRRGFIYPGSEIYGGYANTYSYGPYGSELKKTVKDLWWKRFVRDRSDILGMDGPIFLHPKAWEASGHVESFSDAMVDCKDCKSRFRVDHLIEDQLGKEVEGLSLKELNSIIDKEGLQCPKCQSQDFTPARAFNLMFTTSVSKTSENNETIYLRPETAQAMFLDYKNVLDSTRVKPPFGLAQIGKAFRNEITPGNFIFRLIEFEQMEIEYFIPPGTWEENFESWQEEMMAWCNQIGLKNDKLSLYEHPKEKLSHYSKRTIDIMYHFPFGTSELYGLAYRTDFDLASHSKHSKTKLEYHDLENKTKWLPHVIEPTFGVDRTVLALLCQSYLEEDLPGGEKRVVLQLPPQLSPVKVGVFPLMKKPELMRESQKIFEALRKRWTCEHDISGSIGKRYRRQDELGTPFCVTVDYDSLEDGSFTLRHRDSMEQSRTTLAKLMNLLETQL